MQTASQAVRTTSFLCLYRPPTCLPSISHPHPPPTCFLVVRWRRQQAREREGWVAWQREVLQSQVDEHLDGLGLRRAPGQPAQGHVDVQGEVYEQTIGGRPHGEISK